MRPLVTLPGKLTVRLWGLPRWWGDKDVTNWATTMYSSTCCAGGVHDTLAVDEERISTLTFVGESGGAAHWQELKAKWLGSYYTEWTTYKSWFAYWSSKMFVDQSKTKKMYKKSYDYFSTTIKGRCGESCRLVRYQSTTYSTPAFDG